LWRRPMKMILPSEKKSFEIDLSENLLKTNAQLAQENRVLFDKHGIYALDILGSIGSGKTTLIQAVVGKLKDRYRIASIAGDLTTTIDADRIRTAGADVVQINTGGECHLDANIVKNALAKMNLDGLDLLLIENVGNLICPAEFPVGAHQRIVVVSTTEGPYMVVKHPYILMDASMLVVNKVDLADVMQVDVEQLKRDALTIKPGLKVVFTDARAGEGVENLIEAMELPKP
jgi:hydrogenase nickel incorporation protein HypB